MYARLPTGRQYALLLDLLALLLLIQRETVTAETGKYQGSTWSIIAADPTTGDVGIALASCVPVHADAVAALVPGKGVASAQASVDLRNRDRVFDLLLAGRTADEIVAEVTRPRWASS